MPIKPGIKDHTMSKYKYNKKNTSAELYRDLLVQGGINPVTVRAIRRSLLRMTENGAQAWIVHTAEDAGVCADYVKLCYDRGALRGYGYRDVDGFQGFSRKLFLVDTAR